METKGSVRCERMNNARLFEAAHNCSCIIKASATQQERLDLDRAPSTYDLIDDEITTGRGPPPRRATPENFEFENACRRYAARCLAPPPRRDGARCYVEPRRRCGHRVCAQNARHWLGRFHRRIQRWTAGHQRHRPPVRCCQRAVHHVPGDQLHNLQYVMSRRVVRLSHLALCGLWQSLSLAHLIDGRSHCRARHSE